MKKLLVIILMFSLTFIVFSAEALKKGESYTATEDCIILTKSESVSYYHFLNNDLVLEINKYKYNLVPDLNTQIANIIFEKDQWIGKYNDTVAMNEEYKKRIKTQDIELKIAWSMAGIGWSFTAGFTAGIIIYYVASHVK
jgi:hypothetical protein